jgi:hypothetical protein
MMRVLGRDDASERQHELAELGSSLDAAGPLRSMTEAGDLSSLRRWFETSLTDLHTRVANTPEDDVSLPYLRALMVLTKKVELDLNQQIDNLTRLYRDLDEMHDFVHEVYPVG